MTPEQEERARYFVENGVPKGKINNLMQCSAYDFIINNNIQLIKEPFDDTKIEKIQHLSCITGITKKILANKFDISKEKVQEIIDKIVYPEKTERYYQFHQFDSVDTPEKAYWLGFFYADAYNGQKWGRFVVTLAIKDKNHLIKLARFLSVPGIDPLEMVTSQPETAKYPSSSFVIYRTAFCERMTELGCMQAKSLILTYPEWMPEDLHVHFIRGAQDGDGCITLSRKTKEWKWSIVGTKEWCAPAQKIIEKATGEKIHLVYISESGKNTWQIGTSGNEKIVKILNWIYKDTDESLRLTRKYEKYLELIKQQNNRNPRYIKQIWEPSGIKLKQSSS
jgi:hypothetical protein